MKGRTSGTVPTALALTEQQRKQISEALDIDIQYVPSSIGVLGMSQPEAARLKIPVEKATNFSPAMIMT